MKLIKPSFKILSNVDGESILKEMEIAARTCYKSEGKIEYDWDKPIGELNRKEKAISARKLIVKLIERKHEAMLEFGGSITVKFVCDRGVSHELVRHRMASFAQESTRYCNYGKDEHIQFIIPEWMNIKEDIYTTNNYTFTNLNNENYDDWFKAMFSCETRYNNLINGVNPNTNKIDGRMRKWTPQQARSVLPNSLKTEINIKANIREWRHIFKLRTASGAHPQMRELMCPLLDEFKVKIPILFNDINYK